MVSLPEAARASAVCNPQCAMQDRRQCVTPGVRMLEALHGRPAVGRNPTVGVRLTHASFRVIPRLLADTDLRKSEPKASGVNNP